MANISRVMMAAAATLLLTIATRPVQAQEPLYVTGASTPSAARVTDADGAQHELGLLDSQFGEVREGQVEVASGQHVMLYAESGSVLIVLGPAKFSYSSEPSKNNVVLEEGRLMITTIFPVGDVTPLVITTPSIAGGPQAFEAVNCPGVTYYERGETRATIAFVSETGIPPSMALTVLGQARSINSGEMLTIADGNVQSNPAADWIASSGFGTAGKTLGVAAAQTARPALESQLFTDITDWDVGGGSKYVTSRLEASRFKAEIRQVASTVSVPPRTGASPKGAPQTQGFAGANEVPFLSPAALSVINPTEGVTAIQLNVQARNLLTTTGSRGLGFRGLARLAIAGTFGDGIPTIGPSGLGSD